MVTGVAPSSRVIPPSVEAEPSGRLLTCLQQRATSHPGRLTLGALGVWAATRVALLLAALCGGYTTQSYRLPQRPAFLARWDAWDMHWYLDIAQHGYFYGPDQADRFGRSTHAFFPGTPLLIRVVHVAVRNWTVSGLVVGAVASAVAFVALAHLVDTELAGGGLLEAARRRETAHLTVLALALSPVAVFLVAAYAEGPWLAAGLLGWLAARRAQWVRAGLLVAAATAFKPNGLFLAVGLAVLYAVARRRRGERLLGPPALALLLPLLPAVAYAGFLHHRTGDWNAWQHAQEDSWGRVTTSPLVSWRQTWHAAFDPQALTDFAWARRMELLVALLGLLLIAWLVWRRRWAESTYLAIAWLALGTNGIYLSFPRSTLLWFPLYLLLARVIARRRWVAWAWLSVSAPVALVLTVAFTTGHWVN